ncbi:hypothetical protein P154DRAFT_521107 [Amniculicola lignicola CBS 123094]|uniref:Uncharacterized protein n=1 Tax=Amniculicola lignicola CBS 123094 TaxID=1392246 RepID=A0A6A5WMQ0_9PLEO|nr:hypothetical protein P154DRAFT_521107 [Amniculicola lignicola CBS 123094]
MRQRRMSIDNFILGVGIENILGLFSWTISRFPVLPQSLGGFGKGNIQEKRHHIWIPISHSTFRLIFSSIKLFNLRRARLQKPRQYAL